MPLSFEQFRQQQQEMQLLANTGLQQELAQLPLQPILERLAQAAAVAEGMGTRGDRSRPDDYYKVYQEFYAALEAYHRLVRDHCRRIRARGLSTQQNHHWLTDTCI